MLELGEFPLLNFYEMDLSIFQVGWSSTGLAAVSITNMVVTEFGPEKTMHFPAYVARRNLTPSSPKENIGPWIHSEGHFWYRGSATNQSQEQRLTAFLRQQLEAGNKTLGKTEFDGWECVTTWFASTSCASIYIYTYIFTISCSHVSFIDGYRQKRGQQEHGDISSSTLQGRTATGGRTQVLWEVRFSTEKITGELAATILAFGYVEAPPVMSWAMNQLTIVVPPNKPKFPRLYVCQLSYGSPAPGYRRMGLKAKILKELELLRSLALARHYG